MFSPHTTHITVKVIKPPWTAGLSTLLKGTLAVLWKYWDLQPGLKVEFLRLTACRIWSSGMYVTFQSPPAKLGCQTFQESQSRLVSKTLTIVNFCYMNTCKGNNVVNDGWWNWNLNNTPRRSSEYARLRYNEKCLRCTRILTVQFTLLSVHKWLSIASAE